MGLEYYDVQISIYSSGKSSNSVKLLSPKRFDNWRYILPPKEGGVVVYEINSDGSYREFSAFVLASSPGEAVNLAASADPEYVELIYDPFTPYTGDEEKEEPGADKEENVPEGWPDN